MKRKTEAGPATREEYWQELIRWGEILTGTDGDRIRRAEEIWDRLETREGISAGAGIFLPLAYLAGALGLRREEKQILALVALGRCRGSIRRALDREGVLLLLTGAEYPGGGWTRALAPEGALMGWCLTGTQDGSLGLDRRMEAFLLEEGYGPEEVRGLWLEEPEEAALPRRLAVLAERMTEYLKSGSEERTTFLLWGQPGAGRRSLARAVAFRLGQPVMMARGELLRDPEFRRALLREVRIQQCPVCILAPEEDTGADGQPLEEWTELLAAGARHGCGFVVTGTDRTPAAEPGRWRTISVGLGMPDGAERRELWTEMMAHYPFIPELDPEELAGRYRLTPGQIRDASAEAMAQARWQGKNAIDGDCLALGCRAQLRHGLWEKARRVETVFSWEELILPERSKGLLRSACDQIRHREQVYEGWGFGKKLPYGAGLSMLFSGPPGTGKTMAAQIVARELGLELYKVELPAVVSKYVGETEQNLNRIFREAARSQAVLFFDEADVLFGKRTEVKDAHDKYNNMEAAYLLQKMEEYAGVSVLATNFLQNFDEAFKRRIRFIIEFPFPDARSRRALWQGVFPSQTPLSPELDFEYLAEHFELSGSGIKNTAVNAAFLAARAGVSVGMAQVLTALKRELEKSGTHVSREEFGAYHMLVEQEDGDGGV